MSLLRKILVNVCLIILASAGLLVPFQPVKADITCSASASAAWQNCGPIEAYPGLDIHPSALSAIDGTLWLAWEANHDSSGGLTPNFNILYATRLTNGTWLPPSPVTTKGGQNQMPSVAQTRDGTIYVFWTYHSTSSTHSQIYYRTFNGVAWSAYTQLTSTTSLNDTGPSATVGPDGTLWLAWTRDNDTVSGTGPVMRQLWYKTLKNSVWSLEANITSPSDVNWNWQPSVMVGKDGVPRMAFAKGQNSNGHYQINYMTFNNGRWSPASPIVSLCTGSTCTGDVNPSIMQDRNGTLSLFWSRQMVVGTLFDYVIYRKYSIDNGVTWNVAETALTNISCGTGSCDDSEHPAAVQSNTTIDKNLWVLYSTTPAITSFDIWGLETVNPIYPVHDVAVTLVSQANAFQYPGGLPSVGMSADVTVSVTVKNLGDFPQNVTVTLTISNTTSYNLVLTASNLAIGGSTVLQFKWTTVFDVTKPGWYDLSASAAAVPGETVGNQGDNARALKHSVHLLPPGDVDQDGSTTAIDVSQIKLAYGSQPCSVNPNNPICYLYNPYFDYTNTQFIDSNDISIAIAHYGIFT